MVNCSTVSLTTIPKYKKESINFVGLLGPGEIFVINETALQFTVIH